MRAKSFYLFMLVVMLPLAHQAMAVTYTNGINESSWQTQTSVFECRMEHAVPYYGRAVFGTRAGESSRFYLNALSSRFSAGQADVISKPPAWLSSRDEEDLGSVRVKRGRRPMWVGSRTTEKMLSELNRGQEIAFMQDAWYEDESQPDVSLVVSSIGFREEYRKYLNCLGSLLPANYDQLKRSSILFQPGLPEDSGALTRANKRLLDNVLLLVKHDTSIQKFIIDGHTSAPGDRSENLELAKRRATLVADYLRRGGIPDDAMMVRWHGERYPVASNSSASGRAKNRRVTLRLEKVEEGEVTPMAAK